MKIIAWERISWSLRPGEREQEEIMTFTTLNICCIYCNWPPFHCHLYQHHYFHCFSGSQSSAEGSPLDPRKNYDRYIDWGFQINRKNVHGHTYRLYLLLVCFSSRLDLLQRRIKEVSDRFRKKGKLHFLKNRSEEGEESWKWIETE